MVETEKMIPVVVIKVYKNGELCETFTQEAPEVEDAQFHIDDWKQIFDKRQTLGLFESDDVFVSFNWTKNSRNFVCDSWNL